MPHKWPEFELMSTKQILFLTVVSLTYLHTLRRRIILMHLKKKGNLFGIFRKKKLLNMKILNKHSSRIKHVISYNFYFFKKQRKKPLHLKMSEINDSDCLFNKFKTSIHFVKSNPMMVGSLIKMFNHSTWTGPVFFIFFGWGRSTRSGIPDQLDLGRVRANILIF